MRWLTQHTRLWSHRRRLHHCWSPFASLPPKPPHFHNTAYCAQLSHGCMTRLTDSHSQSLQPPSCMLTHAPTTTITRSFVDVFIDTQAVMSCLQPLFARTFVAYSAVSKLTFPNTYLCEKSWQHTCFVAELESRRPMQNCSHSHIGEDINAALLTADSSAN